MSETEHLIQLSDAAASRITTLAAQKNAGFLRLAVLGGGCAGFQYDFALVKKKNSEDLVIEKQGAVMVIDPVSANFLQGAEVDFIQEPIGAYFKVNNPNAVSGCGCGSSFSVA